VSVDARVLRGDSPGATRLTETPESAVDAAQAFAERSPETTRTRTITWQDPLPTAAVGAEMSGLEYVRAIQVGEIRRRRSAW